MKTLLSLFTLLFCCPTLQAADIPENAQADKKALRISAIENSMNSDISAVVMTEAYKRLDRTIELIPLPGKAALTRANLGETDAELFRIDHIDKKFTNLIKVPVSINVLEGVAFVTDPKIKISTWDELRDYRIGVRKGIQFTNRATEGMNRIAVDSNKQLFQMLNAGRLDIVVLARLNGIVSAQATGFNNIIALEPAIERYPLFHYLHHSNADLLAPLSKVLTKMKAEGFIAQSRQNAINAIMKK